MSRVRLDCYEALFRRPFAVARHDSDQGDAGSQLARGRGEFSAVAENQRKAVDVGSGEHVAAGHEQMLRRPVRTQVALRPQIRKPSHGSAQVGGDDAFFACHFERLIPAERD